MINWPVATVCVSLIGAVTFVAYEEATIPAAVISIFGIIIQSVLPPIVKKDS